MAKQYKKALFIFRRDLRLDDNTALNEACALSDKIVPIFIFDPRQIGKNNKYYSMNAIQFMGESLQDLYDQLKKKGGQLYFFNGKPEEVVKKLIKDQKIEAVFFNKDYTPFSLKRDKAIGTTCTKHKIAVHSYDDVMLQPPEDVQTGSGTPYAVFTPYFKKSSRIEVREPETKVGKQFYSSRLKKDETKTILQKICPKKNKDILVEGGRANAKKILKNLDQFSDYKKERDFPAISTTHLSAYIKFGCVSIREVYYAIEEKLNSGHLLQRQLYWHDFWTYIAYYSPFVYGHAYHKKYDKLAWSKNKKDFKAWCEGKTGFPIVDAGMQQMNTTGFMHNRVRMIVASFLTKDLHINWLWGEQYFAQQLVDYDPAVNNGNWQWSASVGCDAQPYFRIFNPWTQQKKFDPDCTYIKEWIPKLKNIEPKIIHNWWKETSPEIKGYPHPMVDHDKERNIALKAYKKVG